MSGWKHFWGRFAPYITGEAGLHYLLKDLFSRKLFFSRHVIPRKCQKPYKPEQIDTILSYLDHHIWGLLRENLRGNFRPGPIFLCWISFSKKPQKTAIKRKKENHKLKKAGRVCEAGISWPRDKLGAVAFSQGEFHFIYFQRDWGSSLSRAILHSSTVVQRLRLRIKIQTKKQSCYISLAEMNVETQRRGQV